jgi:branched-subunit amino acid aminotransferase/4-amino-4-deoxychorismate lyase
MKHYCYVNGEIKSTSDAVIGVSDLALQRGYGVFDFARTYNGKLFHFNDHIDRLKHSAAALHLRLPISDSEIYKISEQLIKDSKLERPSVRFILTGGCASAAYLFEDPNFIIVAEELPTYPEEVYTKGAKLITVEYQRELPHVKSINYLNAVRLEPLKRERHAFDILYYSKNGVTECPRSNFFMFKNDTLVTPAFHILYGITRKIVLKLAKDHFSIEERLIPVDEINNVDEAFITSTSKGIVPIIKIDDFEINGGVIGDRTKMVIKLFNEYTRGY